MENQESDDVTPPRPLTPVRLKPVHVHVERGKSWRTLGIPYIFLDDVQYIFQVMERYAPNNPTYMLGVEHQKTISELKRQLAERKGDPNIVREIAELEKIEPPGMVEMSVDDYLPETIEQLLSLNLRGVSEFRMRVGWSDVELDCASIATTVRIADTDSAALEAFEAIKRRLRKRESLAWKLVMPIAFFGPPVAIVPVSIFTLVVRQQDIELFTRAFYALVFFQFLAAFWFMGVWNRRKVVIFSYERDAHKPILERPWFAALVLPIAVALITAGVLRIIGWD